MGTSYMDGFKWVDGRKYEPLVGREYPTPSSPTFLSRAVFWADGLLSCNCIAWTARKSCRHTLDLGEQVAAGFFGPAYRDLRRLAVSRAERRRLLDESCSRLARFVAGPEAPQPETPPYRRISV